MTIQHWSDGRKVELTLEVFLEMLKEKKVEGVGIYDLDDARRYCNLDDLPGALAGKDWDLWLNSQLTGHMYLGAPHETDNSCGNCDGARCDGCERVWNASLNELAPSS